jgi:(E)-4-hydroxy-3-methylbut-2-enyl-diphosphate synthase
LGQNSASTQVRGLTAYAQEHHVTIAVMGCRVNGPGETDNADLGLWCGPSTVNLKKKSVKVGTFSYDQVFLRLQEELDRLIAERG